MVSQPFEHLIVDCVGPLPRSKSGCSYLLMVMCQVTRYPAAYPLCSITAQSVLKALTQFMSVFGVPKIIQSDQGSNFTSLLRKVSEVNYVVAMQNTRKSTKICHVNLMKPFHTCDSGVCGSNTDGNPSLASVGSTTFLLGAALEEGEVV